MAPRVERSQRVMTVRVAGHLGQVPSSATRNAWRSGTGASPRAARHHLARPQSERLMRQDEAVSKKTCQRCLKNLPAGSQFCPYCGTPQGASSPVWGPPPAPAMSRSDRPKHVLHAVLTVLTMGLWAPVWLWVTIRRRERRPSLPAPSGLVADSVGHLHRSGAWMVSWKCAPHEKRGSLLNSRQPARGGAGTWIATAQYGGVKCQAWGWSRRDAEANAVRFLRKTLQSRNTRR